MSKSITLPSGNTVTLRDPKTLKHKDRRKVLEQGGKHDNQVMASLSMIDGIIAILVESWSLDLIIPSVHIDSLGELSMPDYDALAEEANKVQEILFPAVSRTTESERDENSPFAKSSD